MLAPEGNYYYYYYYYFSNKNKTSTGGGVGARAYGVEGVGVVGWGGGLVEVGGEREVLRVADTASP